MSRPRSRSVYSSEPVKIKASIHPSKRRSTNITFSSGKYKRKASYTRRRRLSPIEEGNYEDRSSPSKSSAKDTIQISRKQSVRHLQTKKSKKSFIDSIKSIFKF